MASAEWKGRFQDIVVNADECYEDAGNTLDASSLEWDESLAGRDLSGWRLTGDFSERDFSVDMPFRLLERR